MAKKVESKTKEYAKKNKTKGEMPSLGSGMAEKTKKTLQNRTKDIDKQLKAYGA